MLFSWPFISYKKYLYQAVKQENFRKGNNCKLIGQNCLSPAPVHAPSLHYQIIKKHDTAIKQNEFYGNHRK